ncbi:hypothetical protein [Moorena producens]|uniref:hypothetical protein n=1 Tax=Moorena producens TaxID=1155739 RepID=UPI00131439A8|nr:hypothetical protein [Moorena producens]
MQSLMGGTPKTALHRCNSFTKCWHFQKTCVKVMISLKQWFSRHDDFHRTSR